MVARTAETFVVAKVLRILYVVLCIIVRHAVELSTTVRSGWLTIDTLSFLLSPRYFICTAFAIGTFAFSRVLRVVNSTTQQVT